MQQKTNADRLDRYWTPPFATRVLLDRWRKAGVIEPPDRLVDPCCGECDILTVANAEGYRAMAGDIHVPDKVHRWWTEQPWTDDRIREVDATHEDAGTLIYGAADAVVTNPPYSADTATAGEVLSDLVQWRKPVAALVNNRFTAEACTDRANLLYGEWRPARIINLGRVEFAGPAMDSSGTPVLSQWVTWEPGYDGPTRTSWVTPQERAKATGQTDLSDFMEES